MARCCNDIFGWRVLGNEGTGTCLERIKKLLVSGIHRENDDAHIWVGGSGPLGRINT